MIKPLHALLGTALAISSATAFAANVNPYNYSEHADAINQAKWQRGYNSDKQCQYEDCESVMGEAESLDYVWAKSSDGELRFSTNGVKGNKWRSELRYMDNFNRGSTRTMTVRVRYWPDSSTSEGFTVAQLHMEDSAGPPARLEVLDESHYAVTFRDDDLCTTDCTWTDKEYSTGITGFKDVQLNTSGNYVNVSVEGETHSYLLTSNWPSKGNYYWKTGIYLQDEGTAYTGYEYIYW